MDIGHRGVGEKPCRVIDRRGADIDAGVAARQARRPNAGMGQRVVGDFEQMPMLGISLLGLARAHAERRGIKAPYVIDDAGGEGVATANLVMRGVVKGACGEAIGRDPGHAAAIVPQQLP